MRIFILIAALFVVFSAKAQDVPSPGPKWFTLKDSTAATGSLCVLRNIHFDMFHYDQNIDSNSYPVMDSIVRFLKRNPTMKIMVNAHLSPTQGQMCWVPRHAHTIVDYLIKQGIDSVRLVPREWGTTQPIVPLSKIKLMKTDKERMEAYRLDRRIVLQVMDPIKK